MRLPLCLPVVGPGSHVIIAGLGGVQQGIKDCIKGKENTKVRVLYAFDPCSYIVRVCLCMCASYPGDLTEPLLHQLCVQLLDPLLCKIDTKRNRKTK